MLDGLPLAPRIEAGRLALRPPRPADAALIDLYLGDPRVARMLTAIPHPYPPGAADALIERALAGRRSGPLYVMDASGAGGPDLVGLVFVNRGERSGEFSIGYCVGPPFWNTGYATEAVRAVVDHLFVAGAEAVTAVVFHDNEISARVPIRLRFAYEGDGETFCAARGAVAPVWRYRLERARWRPS
ncbi:MAG TPA: GNAT family N-acetyltransferase [Paracoccaceae bacterium]|nr:GNAT family N-acetyltransferase [Paracoccaceae bacterium]